MLVEILEIRKYENRKKRKKSKNRRFTLGHRLVMAAKAKEQATRSRKSRSTMAPYGTSRPSALDSMAEPNSKTSFGGRQAMRP
jgi:hypothetical protein